MRIEIDTHTHTVLSGHAFSTLLENVCSAKESGLKGFVMTEHGPAMFNAPPEWHILALPMLPEEIEGIKIYTGIEANIMDFKGKLDINQDYMKSLDFAIASMHNVILENGMVIKNTEALIGALNNTYVDAIGHPGNPSFPIDKEALVKEAKRLNKILEINNHSFKYRKGSRDHCAQILKLCRQYGVRVCVSSDAHFCQLVGKFNDAIMEIMNTLFPEELIVNATVSRFESYLKEKMGRLKI